MDEIAKLRRECDEGRNPRDAKVHARAGDRRALPFAAPSRSRARRVRGAVSRRRACPRTCPRSRCTPAARACRSRSSPSRRALSSPRPRRCVSSRSAGLKVDGEVVADKALVVAGRQDGRRAGRQAQVRAGDRHADAIKVVGQASADATLRKAERRRQDVTPSAGIAGRFAGRMPRHVEPGASARGLIVFCARR